MFYKLTKAARKILVKLTPVVSFTNILCAASTHVDLKSSKKYSQAVSLFCAFEICAWKRCLKNVGEVDTWMSFL